MKKFTEPPPGAYRVWRYLPARVQNLILGMIRPKITYGVAAGIADERGRILLARHVYRRSPWSLPGGFVGRGEQPPAALAREMREELGIEAAVGTLLHAETCMGTRHLTLYYQVEISGSPQANLTEIDELRFCAPAEWEWVTGAPAPQWLPPALAQSPAVA